MTAAEQTFGDWLLVSIPFLSGFFSLSLFSPSIRLGFRIPLLRTFFFFIISHLFFHWFRIKTFARISVIILCPFVPFNRFILNIALSTLNTHAHTETVSFLKAWNFT